MSIEVMASKRDAVISDAIKALKHEAKINREYVAASKAGRVPDHLRADLKRAREATTESLESVKRWLA